MLRSAMLQSLTRQFLLGLTRILVGAHPSWDGTQPSPRQRIYFANHSSHLDGLTLFAALPDSLRKQTSLVAAKDYWSASSLRMFLATSCLNAILIDRQSRSRDPLKPIADACLQGRSVILFPEGTRTAEPLPGAFKSGLFHLAKRFPDIELIPVYLENLHRTMGKGDFIPLPILCIPRFGAPQRLLDGESKDAFLTRMRESVIDLAQQRRIFPDHQENT